MTCSAVHPFAHHALCQDGCGLRPIAALTPCENDPPGLCDSCRGQTCNCGGCMAEAMAELRWIIFIPATRSPPLRSPSTEGGG